MRRGGLRRHAVSAACAALAFALAPSAKAAAPAGSAHVVHVKKGERPEGERRGERAREHFRVGALAGVGFPRPFAIEGFVKIERLIGVGLEYSLMPRVKVMNVDASFEALAIDLRVFPLRGAFFIGLRAGRQWLDAATTVSTPIGSFAESMAASTWFVNPRAGFLFTFESGITLGIDAGVQLPIRPSYSRDGLASEAGLSRQGIEQTLVAVSDALGNAPTPTVDLLRLGFLF